jgi:glycosyltransferase involved in cell wall biosynthesis
LNRLVARMRAAALRVLSSFSEDRRLVAPVFDAAWYRQAYPDVVQSGFDGLTHFLYFGWKEGRDPSPRFSVSDYLAANPTVADSGVNPVVHSLKSGGTGIAPSPYGFRYKVLEQLAPLDERIALAKRDPPQPDPDEALTAALAGAREGLRRLHVTFSHDDYAANLGGVQLGLQREAAAVGKLGRDHLHLYPAKPWPVVRLANEKGALGVLFNGRKVGVFTGKTVAKVLRASAGPKGGASRSFAIHSLLGHNVAETVAILSAVGLKRGFFWLHDFASLCAGFHLLRNDVADCAAPPPDSAACSICVYRPERMRHLAEHEALFGKLELTVVSPSQSALDLWLGAWDFSVAGALVHPHAELRARRSAPIRKAPRLRVAYAGLPSAHKGWLTFLSLAQAFADDSRYEFLHFGHQPAPGAPMRFVKAAVSPEDPLAMQRALEAADPDIVIVWPLCRETFSFVTFEAAAAGCAIITNPDSGNVAAVVAERGLGLVLADEQALRAAFETGEVQSLSRAARKPALQDIEFSALTADLVREELPV